MVYQRVFIENVNSIEEDYNKCYETKIIERLLIELLNFLSDLVLFSSNLLALAKTYSTLYINMFFQASVTFCKTKMT